ncbi:MAG: gliding motility-associated C-terminal domain-containing protein [Bacteroidetes bacterium]|nr:gliding motility-associated C-terminal domain-containing protein [Bacteroidota bacterium]
MKYVVYLILLLSGGRLVAQTCTGGLGDPIVNITFGQGVNPGPALAPGVTSLNWLSDYCPNDGQYSIVTHTAGCFNDTWQNIKQDHTGNQGGYFMLVNASYDPSDFYVQTINGLCGGTTYQFAAWVINVVARTDRIQPNITFQIEKTDGTVLQSINTGDIPPSFPAKWNQYALYFTTPAGISSVVVRMRNNAPGGTGNDIGLDDITFRPAGPSMKTSVTGFSADTVKICEKDQQVLHLSTTVESCFVNAVYQWQESKDGGKTWTNIPGMTGTTYDRPYSTSGLYLYRMTVAEAGNVGISTCTVASSPTIVNVIKTPQPAVTVSPSSPAGCKGKPETFTATPGDGGPGPVYQWQVNGSNAGSGGPSFTTSGLEDGDKVQCFMTSNAACVINPLAISNIALPRIKPVPVTGVDMTASADHVCEDSVVKFTAIPNNGGSNPSFVWRVNGATVKQDTPVFVTGSLKDGDKVSLVMTGSVECSEPVTASEVIQMVVYPMPSVVLPPDTIIAFGTSVQLDPRLTGTIARYEWSPADGLDNPSVAQPVAKPAATTLYRLEVETDQGCKASDSQQIGVFYEVQLPNAFSPNGDGKNELFRVPASVTVRVHHLVVYNRVGAMVFSTEDVSKGWDGRLNGSLQPAGVYIWEIEYDNPITRKVEAKKGTVILVR